MRNWNAAVLIVVVNIMAIGCIGRSGSREAMEAGNGDIVRQAQEFIDAYTAAYVPLYTVNEKAQWQLNTMIVEGDTANSARANRASEALAAFTGSSGNIEKARYFLTQRDLLDSIQVRQLEVILYKAANYPATVSNLVKERIAAETAQTDGLYGFDFRIDGEPVSTNRIDEILWDSADLDERLKAWSASKEVGVGLKSGLANLAGLRNGTVQALGYEDYFQYQVSDYGMTAEEMVELMRRFNRELRPLFRELHTWTRYTLAEKYNRPVPELIPAHWLPNRWGQDWGQIVRVEGFDLDSSLADKEPEWLVRQGEAFYVSLGFPKLPESFWQLSSLYPLPPGTPYKKNNHASAWSINLNDDVRSLMSVVSNADWWETIHHELGHVYYDIAYSNETVPPLLRDAPNSSIHEAVAALLKPSMKDLRTIGLAPEGVEVDIEQQLLKEAMADVVFIPFSCGVMTLFEHDLHAGPLPIDRFNARWWELKATFQGIAPPSPRGEEYCDAASKTHINTNAAQYYKYAIASIVAYQLRDHIAGRIIGQEPREAEYYGNREVGEFVWSILELGATVDWREMIREKTGEDISARAMIEYYEPLLVWLREQNEGRVHTLPELE